MSSIRSLFERSHAGVEPGSASRRSFLQMIGASVGAATLAACTKSPGEDVKPYVRAPDDVKPGAALHYATTMTLGGLGTGLLVTSREGRPVKVEGSPEHPASLGGSGLFEQAAIYHLLDPNRARAVKHRGKASTWAALLAQLTDPQASFRRDGGAGLRFLVEPSGSPLLAWLQAKVTAALPNARFHAFDPLSREAAYEGTKTAFGRPLEARLDLDKARVLVTLDADLLGEGPFRLRHQRDFSGHRVPERGLNRLYTAESGMTITGANADHRLRARPSEIEGLTAALLVAVSPAKAPANAAKLGARWAANAWVKAAAPELTARGAEGLVVAGSRQPASVHAMAAAINEAIGSASVSYARPPLDHVASGPQSLAALAHEIERGGVDTLVVTAWNPAYTAPADVAFGDLLAGVPNAIYLGLFEDETAERASWFVPATHELEAWGDARALDGTVSIAQPLVEPLTNGVPVAELWAAFAGLAERPARALLRDSWAERTARPDFDRYWGSAVQRGTFAGSAFASEPASLDWKALDDALGRSTARSAAAGEGIEIAFRADSRILDGRFADCAWLQELPDPITKLTWTNALELGPATAQRLGVATGDRVEVEVDGRSVVAAALVVPGHADDAVSLALGYGRRGAEVVARGLGADAYRLRTTAAPWFSPGAKVRKLGGTIPLSLTQEHDVTEGRPVALGVTAADVVKRKLPMVEAQRGEQPTMYDSPPEPGYRWAMTIDTSRCTGCSACILACESENNTLPVGPEQVQKGRVMHWLRVDRYFEGDLAEPTVAVQPLACVHCEDAPCEVVCPVNATTHSDEGLNEMVYNRCVGTRYCSNNCPYKVRHFNYLDFREAIKGSEEAAMNPEVTVRGRGVMEKCSYCVQRIEAARIGAEKEGRPIRDGEIVTACQQACPSQAIVFGSLHDPASKVSVAQRDQRAYALLHDLGTRPRTMHLARVRNPNPELG